MPVYDYEQAKEGTTVLNSGYFRDSFVGIDDYIVIPLASDLSVGIQGDIDIDDSGNGTANNATIITMRRVSESQGGYYSHYHTEVVAERDGSCTFKITEPAYLFGSIDPLPGFILTKNEEYSHQLQIIVCVVLILSVVMSSLLSWVRNRWRT